MDKPELWLGQRTDNFNEAFPNIEAINFTIDDNPWGWYNVRGHRPLRFTSASATSFIPCPNDRCRRGGFDFGTLLRNYSCGSKITDIDKTFPCGGDEGTPAGRKLGHLLINGFCVSR